MWNRCHFFFKCLLDLTSESPTLRCFVLICFVFLLERKLKVAQWGFKPRLSGFTVHVLSHFAFFSVKDKFLFMLNILRRQLLKVFNYSLYSSSATVGIVPDFFLRKEIKFPPFHFIEMWFWKWHSCKRLHFLEHGWDHLSHPCQWNVSERNGFHLKAEVVKSKCAFFHFVLSFLEAEY